MVSEYHRREVALIDRDISVGQFPTEKTKRTDDVGCPGELIHFQQGPEPLATSSDTDVSTKTACAIQR